MTVEIDFPRGGISSDGPKSSSFSKGSDESTALFRKKTKEDDGEKVKGKLSKSAPHEADEFAGVFRQHLTLDLLTKDVRGLGFVKQVNELDVVLETSDGLLVKLPADRISKTFTDSLSITEKTLDDIFSINQAVAFKVYKSSELKNDKRTRPEVTTCPYEVNSHMVASHLVSGLVVNVCVDSVEEKGAVVNFGFSSKVTGFVDTEDLPEHLALNTLSVGQVFMVRIKPKTSARVINASAFAEMDTLESENMTLNALMPGTIVMAQPEKIVRDGVFVELKNEIRSFVRKHYLPPRLRTEMDKIVKPFRVCVMACQQNSPLLILTGNSEVLALSKLEKRRLPEKCKIGEVINCIVYDVDKQQNVYFWLEEDENGKRPLLTAKARRTEIDDSMEVKINKFKIGSEHMCRVIGYNQAERQILVSTKASVMKQKVVSVDQIQPGEQYVVTVEAIRPNGLRVKLYDQIDGHIPAAHVVNRPTKMWQKGFRKGQHLTCRVLFVDHSKGMVLLTAKAALVESKGRIVTQVSDDLVGEVTVGVLVKVLDTGALVVSFYNRVVGLVEAAIAKNISNPISIGMPIKVRVSRVNVSTEKIFLDFGEGSTAETVVSKKLVGKSTFTSAKAKKTKMRPAKPFMVYTAKVIGTWPYGGTQPDTSAELLLNGVSVGRLHASELDLEKYEIGSVPMKTFLNANLGKTVNVKVICVGMARTISLSGRAELEKKFGTSRFVECTLNPRKIAETKRKLRLINFCNTFHYGANTPVFCVFPALSELKKSLTTVSTAQHLEINPMFKAFTRLNEVKDMELESGELLMGTVCGVNSTRRSKCVEITFGEKEELDESEIKEEADDDGYESKKKERFRSKKEQNAFKRIGEEGVEQVALSTIKRPRFMTIEDPGFDWSLADFATDKLVDIGAKRLKKKATKEESEEEDDSDEDDEDEELTDEEDDASDDEEINESEEEEKLKDDEKEEVKRCNVGSAEFRKNADLIIESVSGSEADFTRLVATNPSSAEPWIKCIAFLVGKKDYKKAKAIAEKALKAINFKDTDELFNIWLVYINMEVMFGDEQSLRAVFERACGAADSLKMHKHLVKALCACGRHEDAIDVYESMLKKFRHRSKDQEELWYQYAEHLLEMGRTERSRELLQRALQSAEKRHHINLLCRFAQLEYKHGDAQRGRTMFEKIVHSYARKSLVWNLFVDMVLKYDGIAPARRIFERAIEAMSVKGGRDDDADAKANECSSETAGSKVKALLKKWLDAEEKHGDQESQSLVRERAAKLLDAWKEEEECEKEEQRKRKRKSTVAEV